MNKIEVSGRTTEEAVQIAAKELGVSKDGVDYEIMEEGAKGFLGLGQSPTTISAWVREGFEAMAQAASKPEVAQPEMVELPEESQEVIFGNDEDEFKVTVLNMLEDVLEAMELPAKPVVKLIEGDEMTIEIQGQDVAILIGKQGQTLDALQYLISIAANRICGTRWRLILDADGYRDRYRHILETKAREYADAVKAEGQEAELEPQSARDRRIVHMSLADDPDVYTYSEGEGENRHVVISPRK